MLTIRDEYTRECLAIKVDRKLNSTDVVDNLLDLFVMHGVPDYILSEMDWNTHFPIMALSLQPDLYGNG